MAAPGRSKCSGNYLFVVGFVVALFIGWVVFPPLLYSKKTQPVAFSHERHGKGQGLTCESCHAFREDGSFSGIPKTDSCYDCHNEMANSEDPREIRFIEDYLIPEKEIQWYVYSKQPVCVYFSHAPHVKLAKMDCITCHGPKVDERNPPVYEENRLTGYSRDIWGRNMFPWKSHPWDRMKMTDCSDCHEKNGASNACFVCHK